jgi:hypothetical protein
VPVVVAVLLGKLFRRQTTKGGLTVFKVIGYEPNAECLGCEREKECLVIETESYRGPHCAKCLMREGKKRGTTLRQPSLAES